MPFDIEMLTRSLESRRGHGFGRRGNELAEAHRERWESFLDMTIQLSQAVLTKAAAVKTNRLLSENGKDVELQKLATATANDVGYLGREISTTREALARVQPLALDYMTVPKDTDRQLQYWREQEIRMEYRNKSQHEREAAFIRAAEEANAEVLRAFQSAPGGAWFSGELVDRINEIYAAKRNPEAWSTLQGLQVYHDRLGELADHVGQALLTWKADSSAIEKNLGITLPRDPRQEQLAKAQAIREHAAKGQGADRG